LVDLARIDDCVGEIAALDLDLLVARIVGIPCDAVLRQKTPWGRWGGDIKRSPRVKVIRVLDGLSQVSQSVIFANSEVVSASSVAISRPNAS